MSFTLFYFFWTLILNMTLVKPVTLNHNFKLHVWVGHITYIFKYELYKKLIAFIHVTFVSSSCGKKIMPGGKYRMMTAFESNKYYKK